MSIYTTEIENLYEVSLLPYINDEFADERVVNVELISEDTRKELLDELFSKLRNDKRLTQDEDGNFLCRQKDLCDVEGDYGIRLVEMEW